MTTLTPYADQARQVERLGKWCGSAERPVSLVGPAGTGNTLERGSVQVIDEAGMLPRSVLDIVLDAAVKHDLRLMFVGDGAQLAPVGETVCKAVDVDACPWDMVKLSTIRRQAKDSPIIQASKQIRESELHHLPDLQDDNADGAGIVVIDDYREWEDFMLARCAEGVENGARYIGYTNAAVDGVAKDARRIKYGRAADAPYLPGEILTVNDRCTTRDGAIVVENNSELVVESVTESKGFYLVRGTVEGRTVDVVAMENYKVRKQRIDYLAAEARMAAKMKKRNPWAKFWDTTNRVADLRSAISSTVHKAQGSTELDVFANCEQVTKCQPRYHKGDTKAQMIERENMAADERRRLAYVLATRPSRCLYVTGSWSQC